MKQLLATSLVYLCLTSFACQRKAKIISGDVCQGKTRANALSITAAACRVCFPMAMQSNLLAGLPFEG